MRWIQRFTNYRKALAKLSQAVAIIAGQQDLKEGMDDLMKEGLIQRF